LSKVRSYFSLNLKTQLLLVEALFYLGLARILIYLPFSKLALLLGTPLQETSNDLLHADRAAIKNIANAIHIMSNHTFWDSKCLVRAIAGMNMLSRREIESTLYLGTAKDDAAKLIAHAWLRSGPYYVTGREEMDKFTVVGKFAKRMSGNE
jgi:hypothetical protein